MKVSVIVPNYNGASTLVTTLRSILSQLPDDSDVLVIDDCSTDNSVAEVANTFPEVKIHLNSVNHGASRARNIGIRETSGEWILFVDSDVFLKEHCIAALMEKTENMDILFPRILYPNCARMYPVNEKQAKYLMISPVFLLRRSALAKMVSPSFDETYRIYCEDTDFFLRAYLAGLTCMYQDQAEAIHNVMDKPGNRESRYFLELRNAVYGAIKFTGIKDINQFDHAFKFINILKVGACGLFNFNLFDMRARGYQIPTSFIGQLRLLLNKHDPITSRGIIVLFLLSIKALFWNFMHVTQAIHSRRQVLQQALRKVEGPG